MTSDNHLISDTSDAVAKLSGADVARGFHREIVGPLIERELPGFPYAAGRLGSGSDVLGVDDAMSRDHDWGCRLTVLVDEADRSVIARLNALLRRDLPERYEGMPIRFATTWDSSVSHKIETATVADFATSRLGVTPKPGLSCVDWLTLTGQSVLEVIAGPIFTDTTTELAVLHRTLSWYPTDIEKYVLAAGWQRIGQQLPLMGRTAQRGQYLQSRLLSAAIVGDVVRLAFVLHRQWAPYTKWRELMFEALPIASEMSEHLAVAATADNWQDRENAVATAARMLLDVQRAQGLPTPAEGITPFWDRPYAMIDLAVPQALLAAITDPQVAQLPAGVGSIEQWVDNTDILAHPHRRAAAAAAYRAWLDQPASAQPTAN